MIGNRRATARPTYPAKSYQFLGPVNTNHIYNEGEVDKSSEHDIELFEAGEDAPIAFETAEQALDFVAPFVELAVVWPWILSVRLGRNNGLKAKL